MSPKVGMEKRAIAAEGTHSAIVTNITIKVAKNNKKYAIFYFQLLDHRALATALLFFDSAEVFLRGVPDYKGSAVDELQLLGRGAQIAITHTPGSGDRVFANADLSTIVWETEPPRPQEPSDAASKTVILCASHPKNGEMGTGRYFYRCLGRNEIHTYDIEAKSVYEVTVVAIRALLSSAASKRVSLRIFTDLKPAVQVLKQEATDSRCSLHWKPGTELKRLLFRGLRTPYVAKRPVASVVPGVG